MTLPFPGDVTATANGALLLSLAAAILYGVVRAGQPSWRRTLIKTAAVGLLAVLSFEQGGPPLLTAALALAAAGDAALSRDGDRALLAGLTAFLLGHFAYIDLFVEKSAGVGILAGEPWRAIAAVVLVAFGTFMLFRLLAAAAPGLRLPVAIYVAAIALMGLAALMAPGWGLALGAAFFIASDALVAMERVLLPPGVSFPPWAGLAAWALYYLAQLLIALTLLT